MGINFPLVKKPPFQYFSMEQFAFLIFSTIQHDKESIFASATTQTGAPGRRLSNHDVFSKTKYS